MLTTRYICHLTLQEHDKVPCSECKVIEYRDLSKAEIKSKILDCRDESGKIDIDKATDSIYYELRKNVI